MGGGVFALAVGVNRTSNTDFGAVLLAIFGFGMIIAGMPDAGRPSPRRLAAVLTAVAGIAMTIWTALAFRGTRRRPDSYSAA